VTTWSGTLGEALDVLIDHRGKTPKKLGGDWDEQGVPVYSATHIKEGRLAAENARKVSEELFKKWMPTRLRKNDVLLTSEAPLGEVALVMDDRPACLGQRLFGLRGRDGILDSRYLYYLLQYQPVRSQILGRASGTTVSGIRQAELVRVRLDLPSPAEQRAVAELLGTLDEKIESNRRIRATARQLGLAMVDAAISRAPSRAQVDELAASVARGVSPSYTPDGDLVLNQRCIRDGFVEVTFARRMVSRDVAPEKLAREGDVLVNSTGVGTLGRVGRWAGPPTFVDSHITIVRPDIKLFPPTVLSYCIIRAEADIETLGDGTTGQTELSRERLRRFEIDVPETSLAADIEDDATELERMVSATEHETSTLQELRDALLAPLLSGRLRVSAGYVGAAT
jgi:type I restriction enzyme S subunit